MCATPAAFPFHADGTRRYLRCGTCRLVFVGAESLPTPEEERRQYDLHRNRPDDPGYRQFLSRLFEPMHARLSPGSQGLDFGCGPGPALGRMFEEAGHRVREYDPIYAQDETVFEERYDFITASEVVEHLHRPREELDRLWDRLQPGGWLGVMTKRVRDEAAFRTWHYRLDPTHVVFFGIETFEWLAARWGAEWTAPAADVVLMRKP